MANNSGTSVDQSHEELFARLHSLIKRSEETKTARPPNGEVEEVLAEMRSSFENADERLTSSEERIRTLVEVLPVALVITTESGEIIAGNPMCVTLFKCSYDDLIGRRVASLFPASHNPNLSLSNLVALADPDAPPQEVVAQKFDGATFPAEIVCKAFSSFAQPLRILVVHDVTIKHEVERLKQEFVEMISHDLRSPLASIQCFLELVGRGHFDGNASLLQERANRAEHAAGRLLSMINNLLDLHKMEAGRLEMFFDLVCCADVVQAALDSVAGLTESRKITVNSALVPKNLYVRADYDYCVQVLVNLLANAIKFSDTGGSVEIAVQACGPEVRISVIDGGRGIAPDDVQRIFDRFEQTQMSDARVKGGSGLGLAICKAIIEQHGGAIGVETELGRGSTFWFTLPRIEIDMA